MGSSRTAHGPAARPHRHLLLSRAARNILVACSAALLASDLIARATGDLDLFAATPT